MCFWDTTENFIQYDPLIKDLYLKNKVKYRISYNRWTSKISNKNFKNIDWWASSVPERNPLKSKIYHYFCILKTLDIIKKKKIHIKKIRVDNFFLKKIINSKFINLEVQLIEEKKYFSLKFLKVIIYHLTIFLMSKLSSDNINSLQNSSLVDTFLINKEINSKRYYGNLEKKTGNKKVFFIPTFYNIKFFSLFLIIYRINKNKKYILKEKFLTFKDFYYAASYYFRLNKLNIKNSKFSDYDFTDLINFELRDINNFSTIINGINNYLFFKNLKNNNIRLNCILSWFENTSVDKCWNFAINHFYTNIPSYGYQGFTCYKDFFCLDPTDYEVKYQIIPKKIVLIGKGYENSKKEFSKKINLVQGKALRFHYMNYKSLSKNYKNTILVVLTAIESINNSIWNTILNSEILRKELVLIKTHPIINREKFFLNKKIPKNFVIINSSFEKVVKKAKIVVTAGASSTIIESMANGAFVLIPFNNRFDELSLNSVKIEKTFYKVCKDLNDFEKKLSDLLKKNVLIPNKKIYNLRKKYFNLHLDKGIIDLNKIL